MERNGWLIASVFLGISIFSCLENKNDSEPQQQKQTVQINDAEQVDLQLSEDAIQDSAVQNTDTQTDEEEFYAFLRTLPWPMPFLDAVRSGDRNEIVKFIDYPLVRPYPLPKIRTKEEMFENFDMIFTKELLEIIANSDYGDWETRGLRGIYFIYDYELTAKMNYDGTIFYLPASEQEIELQIKLLEEDRARLLPEFRQYDMAIGIYSSPTYLLRVDQISDDNYRALSWERSNTKTMSDMPDIILLNGELYTGVAQVPSEDYRFVDNNMLYIIDAALDFEYKGRLFIGKKPESYGDDPAYIEYHNLPCEVIEPVELTWEQVWEKMPTL